MAGTTVAVVLGAVGFLPLFGGPGYESSLASGLVAPAAAAVATAIDAAERRAAPLEGIVRGVCSGAFMAAIALAIATIHGVRAGMCDPLGGIVFFLITAGVGSLLGGVWGAVAGEAVAQAFPGGRHRALCAALACAGPLAGIGISLLRFYASPIIFAFDPFFGYFSGTLYDTAIDLPNEICTYRAGSAAVLVGAVLVAAAMQRKVGGRLFVARPRDNPRAFACLVSGSLLFGVQAAIAAEGSNLGHTQSARSLAAALGGRAFGDRCDIVYPDVLTEGQANLLVRDCEEQLTTDEAQLGARLRGRITVYEFSDAAQKRKLMGAGSTSIAKPWRREVYVQLAAYPHPVLGHEIAHVVAGTFARGLFRIGGAMLPNPGLIEGVAMVASPDDDALTDVQWARAMLVSDLLPSSHELFSLGFLSLSAQRSYTAAAAFVQWVEIRWGLSALHRWYAGASIESLTGSSFEALDRDFRSWLQMQAPSPEADRYAQAAFARPSVWQRKCPHWVDSLVEAGIRCRDSHRWEQSEKCFAQAVAVDPGDWDARLDLALVAKSRGEPDAEERLTEIYTGKTTPQTTRDRAEEALADAALVRGDDAAARQIYLSIAARTPNEDLARTLEVKALSVESELARRAITDLLLDPDHRPNDPWIGALSLGRWEGATESPLAQYLVGRNLMLHESWARAADHLDRAMSSEAPTNLIGRELVRDRAICACVSNDRQAIDRIEQLLHSDASPYARPGDGRKEWVLRLLDRCGGPSSGTPR